MTSLGDSRRTVEQPDQQNTPIELCRVDGSTILLRLPATPKTLTQQWFDPEFWDSQSKTVDRRSGRSLTLFFKEAGATHVLRHYWRGGLVRKLLKETYLFSGIRRSRIYRELALLSQLDQMQLPVSKPVAAILQKRGVFYRGSIITQAIPGSLNLLEILRQRQLTHDEIRVMGRTLAIFHSNGVDHADLNIGNVLLDSAGQPHLVDFDRGRLRPSHPRWQLRNMKRLKRSFSKQQRLHQDLHWTQDHWQLLTDSYFEAMPDQARFPGL